MISISFVRLEPIDLIENDVTPAHGQPPTPGHQRAPKQLPLSKKNERNFFVKEEEIFLTKKIIRIRKRREGHSNKLTEKTLNAISLTFLSCTFFTLFWLKEK